MDIWKKTLFGDWINVSKAIAVEMEDAGQAKKEIAVTFGFMNTHEDIGLPYKYKLAEFDTEEKAAKYMEDMILEIANRS